MTTPDKEEMPIDRTATYSEGISGDGASVLRDGQPVAISEVIDLLNAIDTRAQRERRWDEVNRKSSAHSLQQGLATTMTAEAEASRVHGNVAKSEGSDRSAAALICSPSFALRSPTSACNAYEPMREALNLSRDALEQARLYIEGDEETHGRQFGDGNAVRSALAKIDAALSTLHVNDLHHSGSDNERLQSDVLNMNYINSLPQPFLARFCGDKTWWPVHDFEVGTGLMRIDVCGLLEVKSFGEVIEIRDGEDRTHDPDTFYNDEDAEDALNSTDRQTSDDVGRLRALLVALDALIEQCRPLIAVDAFVLRDAIYEAHQARAALKGVPQPATPKEAAMTEAQIKHMVDRFLMWKLPEHFNPDDGISFDPVASKGTPYEFRRSPSGTNLFSAEQATAMVRHMLEGVPQPASEAGKLSTDEVL